jgi:hypothetical protein
MVEELIQRGFPRRIKLVLHNSGVTRRESEIDLLSSRIKISKVRDFRNINPQEFIPSKKYDFKIRDLLTSIFKKLGVIIYSDNYTRIRPWTLHLRSHYSHRFLSKETLLLVREVLQNSATQHFTSSNSALHYRLGDLLTLTEKTFITPGRLIPGLGRIRELGEFQIDVYSDSLEIALSNLQNIDSSGVYNLREVSAWDTILNLSMYKNLIITNSKIGIWGILLRLTYDFEGLIFAPKELEFGFQLILNDSSQLNRITFY